MISRWHELYQQSGWDIERLDGSGSHYSEPLHSILAEMVNRSTGNIPPLVIPRLDDTKQLHFYLIGKDDQQVEEVFTSVKAYLGRAYTTCNPITFRSSKEPFEKIVLEYFPQGFKHISVQRACSRQADKTDTYWVMNSLNKAIEQFHQRPMSVATIKRPVGVILRHFCIALQNESGDQALQLLLELKNHQRLSPRNLLSLEVQALAADGKWRSILNHPKLNDLVKGTVPRRLQNVLLKCISFDHGFSTTPSDYSREEIVEKVEQLFPLFSREPDLDDSESSIANWKLWAIGAVALGRLTAVNNLPNCLANEWVEELKLWSGIELESAENGTSAISTTQPSITDYLRSEPSPECAAKLLHESALANYQLANQIYERLCQYPPAIINDVARDNSWMSQFWTRLQQDYGSQLEINSWHQLFRKLGNICSVEEANSALTFTMDQLEYWDPDSWHAEKVLAEISDISDEITKSTLRNLLPLLLAWLEKNLLQLPSAVIEHFMLLLTEDEQIAKEDLILSNDLLILMLNQPHTKEQYKTLLDCIEIGWEKLQCPQSVESMLDIQETLIDYPCSDQNSRLQHWMRIQPYLIHIWSRLGSQSQFLIRDISRVITGDTSCLPSATDLNLNDNDRKSNDLSGKLLAIYTLTEGAGRRAKEIITRYFPGLSIKLNHDKTATEALLNLASSADYFIFSSKSAAHQAFYPVSKKRNDLIYPKGKGTSSIVREFISKVG